MKLRFWLSGVLLGVLVSSVSSCGGGSSLDFGTEGYSTESSIGSPFVSTSSTSSVIDKARPFAAATTPAERRAAVQTLLSATSGADCTFNVSVSKAAFSNANCYGPRLNLDGTDHPNKEGDPDTPLSGGDLGVWDNVDDTTGDACTAAQVTQLVNGHAGKSHFANMLGAALYCFIKNTSTLTAPTTNGESLTLDTDTNATEWTALNSTLSSGGDTYNIRSAVLTRIQDSSSVPGYRFELTGTYTDDTAEDTFDIVVKTQHLKSSAGALKGSLAYSITNPDEDIRARSNCSASSVTEGLTFAGDLIYENDGTTTTQLLNFAEFCGAESPLTTAANNFAIDPCNFLETDNPTGWANNWNRVLMSYNPTTLDGSYAFSWQAGNGDRATRTFNATLETEGTTRTGTGYYGFANSIQDDRTSTSACSGFSEGLGSIDGLICNWRGNNALNDESAFQDYVQYQVMTLDTTSSTAKWTTTTSNIKFAPVNACQYDPEAFGDFTYNTATSDYSNDSAIVAAVEQEDTIDLLEISEYNFTVPTAPTLSIP